MHSCKVTTFVLTLYLPYKNLKKESFLVWLLTNTYFSIFLYYNVSSFNSSLSFSTYAWIRKVFYEWLQICLHLAPCLVSNLPDLFLLLHVFLGHAAAKVKLPSHFQQVQSLELPYFFGWTNQSNFPFCKHFLVVLNYSLSLKSTENILWTLFIIAYPSNYPCMVSL